VILFGDCAQDASNIGAPQRHLWASERKKKSRLIELLHTI